MIIFIIVGTVVVSAGLRLRTIQAERAWARANLKQGETYVDSRGVLMQRAPR